MLIQQTLQKQRRLLGSVMSISVASRNVSGSLSEPAVSSQIDFGRAAERTSVG
jgi:hypothetical protein